MIAFYLFMALAYTCAAFRVRDASMGAALLLSLSALGWIRDVFA